MPCRRKAATAPPRSRGFAIIAPNGFSLLEMLAVLLLLSVIAAVAVPATGRFLNALEFRKETQAIRVALNQARLGAITSGQPVRISRDDDRAILLRLSPDGSRTPIGTEMNGTLTLEPAVVIFFPEARATPATLTYAHGDRTWRINTDPLTGLLLDNDE